MDIRVAKFLVDAAEELGFEGWEVRENYHGRGFSIVTGKQIGRAHV